jgi:endonuclease VIII
VPEGHTVHALAGALSELTGREVSASSPQGRFPAERIDGAEVAGVEAYGKNLLIDLAGGASVHVHLGMRGKWLRFAPVTGSGLPQTRLRLAVPELAWELVAPSRCELVDAGGRRALVDSLGPDPLRPGADVDEAYRRISAAPGSIGAALLDQSRTAGVGNVFRAEALHARRIDPSRPAGDLDRATFGALWDTLQQQMTQAVQDGRIITVDAEDRLAVPEADARRVYKQSGCHDCGTPVVVEQVGGRTSYHCPVCQPS